MTNSSDSPGVRFPPPFFYVMAVGGGALLNRKWPLPVGHRMLAEPVAVILAIAAFALVLGSMGLFRRFRTSVLPLRPASALVIAGPYRFTRNPMYVGMAALTIALGLLMDTWWPMLLLPVVLVMVQQFVIVREERYLHRRFPEEYGAYTRRVRRWL